jgi:hypothetical protein
MPETNPQAARPSLMLSLFLLTSATLLAQSATDEFAAARVPLEHYLRGHVTGDGTHMRKAFLPTAHIEGLRGGKFNSWTLDQYAALFEGKAAPDEAKRKRWIEKVEVTGTAAIATLRFDYPTVTITDYMVLLKVDGEWRIANKVYSSQPKPK